MISTLLALGLLVCPETIACWVDAIGIPFSLLYFHNPALYHRPFLVLFHTRQQAPWPLQRIQTRRSSLSASAPCPVGPEPHVIAVAPFSPYLGFSYSFSLSSPLPCLPRTRLSTHAEDPTRAISRGANKNEYQPPEETPIGHRRSLISQIGDD